MTPKDAAFAHPIIYFLTMSMHTFAQSLDWWRGDDAGGGDLLTHRNYSWGKIYAKSVEQETLMRHNEGILPHKF